MMRSIMHKTEEKYHRPVTSSNHKSRESQKQKKQKEMLLEKKEKGMNYTQYKSKHGKRPQSGTKNKD